MYDIVESDSKKPLYLGCKKSLMLLSAVLSLVYVKAKYGCSDKISLHYFRYDKILLEENTMSKGYYQAKKILCPMGMEYQKIYAYPNDCILCKHEYEEMHKYPKCGVSWYKAKDDDECSSDESTKNGPSKGVMVSFDHSKV